VAALGGVSDVEKIDGVQKQQRCSPIIRYSPATIKLKDRHKRVAKQSGGPNSDKELHAFPRDISYGFIWYIQSQVIATIETSNQREAWGAILGPTTWHHAAHG